MWKIQHPEGHREINELHVPVNQPIKLTMTSEDVIHSFYVPEMRVKRDVIPGRYTTLWFRPDRTGTYRLFCAEYCGAEHSLMMGKVVVMEAHDYEKWLAGGMAEATGPMSGEELFQAKACNTCHRVDSAALAPILVDIVDHEVTLTDGTTVMVDNEYLRESILNPAAKVVEGYNPVMPTYQGQLSEEEVLALITYIRELGSAPSEEAETEVAQGE
jgi:cytochrome c oxidase subunit 2